MRTTCMSSFLWALLGVFVLSFNLSSCADDEDQQQEQLEEEGEEEGSEYGEEYVEEPDASAGIDTGEPMELGSPVSEDAGIDMGLPVGGDDASMPVPVENSLEEVAADQTAQLGGDSESFQYTIVKGDWLSKIAQRVYGDMYKWPLIANANTQIKNPNLIYPNDVIAVPIIDEQSREFSRSYAQVDQTELQEKYATITIEKGESLSKIAKKVFGSVDAWKMIWQANQANIPNPNLVVEGQVIKVPVTQDMASDFAKFAQL